MVPPWPPGVCEPGVTSPVWDQYWSWRRVTPRIWITSRVRKRSRAARMALGPPILSDPPSVDPGGSASQPKFRRNCAILGYPRGVAAVFRTARRRVAWANAGLAWPKWARRVRRSDPRGRNAPRGRSWSQWGRQGPSLHARDHGALAMARGVPFEEAYRTANEVRGRIGARTRVRKSEIASWMREILGPEPFQEERRVPAPGRHHDPRPHREGAALLEGGALAVAARRRHRSQRRLRRGSRNRARADRPRRARGGPARAAPARLPDPGAPHGRRPPPSATCSGASTRARAAVMILLVALLGRQDLARAEVAQWLGSSGSTRPTGASDHARPCSREVVLAIYGPPRRLPADPGGFARRRPGGGGVPRPGLDRLGRDPGGRWTAPSRRTPAW